MQQEESENNIKSFKCNTHTSENIQRVSLELNTDSSLRCLECILTHPDQTSKDLMIPLNEYIDQAAKQYEKFRSFKDPAPSHLIEALSQEDLSTEILTHHIEQEKQKVENAFNTILQEFTQLCHSTKEDIFRQLDGQIVCQGSNYKYFKDNLDRYYYKANQNDVNPDKNTLLEKLNQCRDTNEAEVLIKALKNNILEAIASQEPLTEIKNHLNNCSIELKRQFSILPKSRFHDDIEPLLKNFRETVNPLIESFNQVDNQFPEFSLTQATSIDSRIIKKMDDVRMLKKWMVPCGDSLSFRLLYRGTRDGMSTQTFYKKCGAYTPTLMILKSDLKRVFGGFTNYRWSGVNFRLPEKSFLFSIDEKEKFPLRKGGRAIIADKRHGPTFGDTDLSLRFLGSKSVSHLGYSYEIQGQNTNKELLARAPEFDLEEIEVFFVQNIPGPDQSLEKKS